MSLKTLLEGELEKAQLQLAARDLVDQVQDIITKLTKLQVEELPALKEGLRGNFDNSIATQFDKSVGDALQSAITAVNEAKAQIDQAALSIGTDGGMPMGNEGDIEQAMDLGGEEGEEDSGEEDMGGDEGGEEAAPVTDVAAGGAEPIGRTKRESRERKLQTMIESLERKIRETRKAKKKMMKKM